MSYWRRWTIPCFAICLALAACGEPVEDDPSDPNVDVGGDLSVDSGFDLATETDSATTTVDASTDVQDTQPVTPNLCGGVRELVYQGLPAEPGAECGPCGDGDGDGDGPEGTRCSA